MSTVIKVENLAKQYRLGQVGTGTIKDDFSRFIAKLRGKEDPFSQVGEVNDRTQKSNSDYVWALQNISFDVQQGDVLGIIGRNVAGKSTLLKILSRTTLPTKGSLKIKGRIASLLEVGTGFHPELTGRENVFQNGAILGMTRKEIARKFDEIVDFSGVERYIDTPVKRYSSGMYVRLAFAVAAHLEPEILIVDEVLAVGDVEFQKKCLGKMKDVSVNEGRTVLFVSHNMAAVKNLCNKGIVLETGQLTFSGDNEEAVGYYSSNVTQLVDVKLNDRKDRKGNGKMRVSEIQFINKSEAVVSELISGEYYKMKFHFDRIEEVNPSLLTFVMQFKNENEEVLTTIATDEQGTIFNTVPNKGYLEIEIPKLLFREGIYTLSYMFTEKLSFTTPHIIMDHIDMAMSITVTRGDFWNSGILNRPKGFIQDSSIKIVSH